MNYRWIYMVLNVVRRTDMIVALICYQIHALFINYLIGEKYVRCAKIR